MKRNYLFAYLFVSSWVNSVRPYLVTGSTRTNPHDLTTLCVNLLGSEAQQWFANVNQPTPLLACGRQYLEVGEY